ncbi:discoidin domain-containing protein [Rhodopirellula sp.]|nr:discoidin domain-containing protein [Rhodopirellula sp.]MDB4679216.1 discoidin domain-containing protein [Rhodopirellula sp.]
MILSRIHSKITAPSFRRYFIICLTCFVFPNTSPAQVLDKDEQLNRETWWYNQDFDWYRNNIPFFECSDTEITTTWYYRWDLLTKHLTYASPNTGYTFTEFIDRPFWSGAYGAISCPAGHQLYEARWLRNPRIANDYSRYWLRTPGAQPRNYSNWLADSIWATNQVHPDPNFLIDLLDDLVKNYEGWERRHFVPDVGLFWQTGHDDGMEFNINSRQTQDILRGAPSYRPSFNSYMWADANAIARIAALAEKPALAEKYRSKASALKQRMLELMWDPKREFFFPVLKNDEERDGFKLRALTRTYESGQYSGDSHGRELIGYVPWQFNLVQGTDQYDQAWKKLMDRDGFYADFGPTTVERNDPMFLLKNSCCWWSGQSWPYATTQTLKALANSLQNNSQSLSKEDYQQLLGNYARSHRKNGLPYLAEALHPDTGSFEGHDGYNHSEHYLHSGYCDLVITGLVGLIPRDDSSLQIHPLASSSWDYFAIDALPYRGHLLSITWDKSGKRYGRGVGFHVDVDKKRVLSADNLQPVFIENVVPLKTSQRPSAADPENKVATNFVVNNDGTFYPRLTASYTSPKTSLSKVNDGNHWYLLHPPNRWDCVDSPNQQDWVQVDFGTARSIHTVKIFVLDDRDLPNSAVLAPRGVQLEAKTDNGWKPISFQCQTDVNTGHRSHSLTFEQRSIQEFRVIFDHAKGGFSGLTELEAWGESKLPIEAPAPPKGNLAFNRGDAEFPTASCSYHDRFGGLPESAIDGITNFLPTPTNRWTSYESPNESDWLEINFGKQVTFTQVDLAIYDDRGGVQTPLGYEVEVWNDTTWVRLGEITRSPLKPLGSQWNTATFSSQTTDKLRIVFQNRGRARSGVSEVMVWNNQ